MARMTGLDRGLIRAERSSIENVGPLGPQGDRAIGAFHDDRPPPASIGALVGQHCIGAFALLAAGHGRLERIALLRQDVALGGQRIDLLVNLPGLVGQGGDLLLDQHFPPPPASDSAIALSLACSSSSVLRSACRVASISWAVAAASSARAFLVGSSGGGAGAFSGTGAGTVVGGHTLGGRGQRPARSGRRFDLQEALATGSVSTPGRRGPTMHGHDEVQRPGKTRQEQHNECTLGPDCASPLPHQG